MKTSKRNVTFGAAIAALFIGGVGAAISLSGATAASSATCEPSVSEALLSNRIVGSSKSYRTDNPAEYTLVRAYLEGGSRPPTTGMTHMGLHLVYLEDTCRAPDVTTTVTVTDTGTTTTTEPPPPPPVGLGVDPATMQSGGTILREDTAAAVDPEVGLWGNIECVTDSRHQHISSGGDPAPRANGSSQGNGSFRRLTVLDGDDFFGERCQLGRNNRSNGENTPGQTSGTFALYPEGSRKITFFSLRQGTGFSTGVNTWQMVMNMKQAQPHPQQAEGCSWGSGIDFHIYGGQLHLTVTGCLHENIWTSPAPANGVWVRYAFDVTYSKNPAIGKIRVYADKNGDGDALDSGEQSPQFSVQTLHTAGSTASGYNAGDPMTAHLRLGNYHNSTIACPAPNGCQVDIDNVQVLG